MIAELIGCTGAGKTTLARLLRDGGGAAHPVVLTSDLIMDRPGLRWIRDPRLANLVADATVLPSFLRALERDRDFVRFASRRLGGHAPSRFAKINYRREVVRNVGRHHLAERVGGDATVLVDEGAVLTAYHLFVYCDAPVEQADLDRFLRLVPMPDRLVYVTAPAALLVDRALRRPDRRRELAAADREAVRRWIARAVDVFDRLVASPAMRDRTLVVGNEDDTPAGRRATVARIAAFLGGRIPDDDESRPATAPGTARG